MSKRPAIPSDKDTPEKVKAFLDHVLNPNTSVRIQNFGTWEKARMYVEENEQWLEPDYSDDPTRTPFWRSLEVDETNWMPMPVQNELVGPIQNERARLLGVGSRPYVRPDRNDPRLERACQVGRDALRDRLEKLGWADIEDEGTYHFTLYGTWPAKSWLEIDRCKTVPLGVKTAVRCPSCEFKLADPSLTEKDLGGPEGVAEKADRLDIKTIPDINNPLVPARVKIKAQRCLTCETQPGAPIMEPIPAEEGSLDLLDLLPTEEGAQDALVTNEVDPLAPQMRQAADEYGQPLFEPDTPPPTLEPFTPTEDEAKSGVDHFGRRLGEDVPLTDTALTNIPVHNYFPQNNGVDVKAGTCSEDGEIHVEDLDWIARHYENGHLVKAESADELMRWHPVLGGSTHRKGAGSAVDGSIFDNHAAVREWHKKPWIENGKKNRGKSIVMAGNVVLLNGPLMIESRIHPGTFIERVHYDSCPWEIRTRSLFGVGAAELAFSQQDLINLLISQVVDARHRFGSPKLLAPEGSDLYYAGFAESGYNSDIYYYRPSEDGQQVKPEPFGNTQMSGEWASELDRYTDALRRILGEMDVEVGDAPKDVTAASALLFLGEKAGKRREPRVIRLREFKRRLFRHQLQLMNEFYREPRYYHRLGKNDRTDIKQFMNVDLMDQTDVQLEEEPVYDSRMFKREAVKEGIAAGTVVADTEGAKRKINKILDVPTVNEDKNLQIERAEEEWINFADEGLDPVICETEDAHQLHFEQHVLDWMSKEAKERKDAARWYEVELGLWGWKERYQAIVAAEQSLMLEPLTPEPLAPEPDPQTLMMAPGAEEAAVQAWEAKRQQQELIDSLPRAPELRIFQVLQETLAQARPPVALDDERLKLLRFKAHYEAHKALAMAETMAATAGAPMPAVPGAPETAGGLVPGANSTVMPGPGTGPGAATAAGGVAA